MLAVFIDVAIELSHSAVVDNVEAIAQSRQEVLIVRYDNKTTLVVVESHNERVNGVEIQMVRRLIEQQDMGLVPSDESEGNARLLTTGKEVHGTQRQVTRDTERAEMLSHVLRGLIRVVLHELLDGRQLRIERVRMMLREHTNTQLAVNKTITIEVLDLTDQRLDEGRLTGTVGTNERDTRLHVNVDVDLGEQVHALLPTNLGLIESHDRRRDLLGVREHENARGVLHDFLNEVNTVDSLDTRLHERGTLGVVTELVDELLEMLNLSFLRLALPRLLLDLLSLRLLILIKVTLEVMQLLGRELNDLIDDHVEEVTSVRNNDDSDVELTDVLLKPNERDQIQMVGRLVEK